MSDQKPTVGRIVHYFPLSFAADGVTQIPGEPAAAIIVHVHKDGTVNLQAFFKLSAGSYFYPRVSQGDGPCQWNWPKKAAGL